MCFQIVILTFRSVKVTKHPRVSSLLMVTCSNHWNAQECKRASCTWSRFRTHPRVRCDANHLWHVCLFKNRAAIEPESLLYHPESVGVTRGVGAGAPLRLPVKFGQVTVNAPRTTPSLRTGNAKQEVAVTDVRRWKGRENAARCLRECA